MCEGCQLNRAVTVNFSISLDLKRERKQNHNNNNKKKTTTYPFLSSKSSFFTTKGPPRTAADQQQHWTLQPLRQRLNLKVAPGQQ